MCGIVAYTGSNLAQPYLLSGLHRLEYRGYDSAGIAVMAGRQVKLSRSSGKVSNLESQLGDKPVRGKTGIGHTRWATHGEPSVRNAHPHRYGDIYLVHNGIIENYRDLKMALAPRRFESETDSEVLAALIDSFYDSDVPLEDAVRQALQIAAGSYGIAVLSPREPGKIVAAKNGSPLIVGLSDDEIFVASDAAALVGYTSQAVHLEDGELAVCEPHGHFRLMDLHGSVTITRQAEAIETNLQAIQKQGYDHFLLKEINEQPISLRQTLNGRVIAAEAAAKLGGLNLTASEMKRVHHLLLVGCGTAYHAGLAAAYYMEQIFDDVMIEAVLASEYRYRSAYLPDDAIAVVISQSGETADTLACLKMLKARGVKTIGIVNVVGSSIARAVDGGVYVHAGPEISVASTKAFTSQVAALLLLAAQLAEAKGAGPSRLAPILDELLILPDTIQAVLDKQQGDIRRLARKYASYEHALYVGRDIAYPLALEGALKLKEISYIHAEGYAMGELKHGPIALIDERFFEVALIPDNWLFEKSLGGLAEIKARGGHLLAITDSDKSLEAEDILRLPTTNKLLAPLVMNVAQQLFAYFMAVERGNEVDQPRNLAKSVTVE